MINRKKQNEDTLINGLNKSITDGTQMPITAHIADITSVFSLKNLENVIRAVEKDNPEVICAISIFVNAGTDKLDVNVCVYPKEKPDVSRKPS